MAGPYALSGSGTQAIAACDHLQVTVTKSPSTFSLGRSFPQTLYQHGFIVPGQAQGWYPSIPISQSPLLIPISRDVDRFGYSLLQGATASVTEVTVAAIGNPTRIALQQTATLANAVGQILISYTVPVNRRTRIDNALVGLGGSAQATNTYVTLTLAGAYVLLMYSPADKATWQTGVQQLQTPLVLNAGEGLQVYASNNSGASLTFVGTVVGWEFDSATWSPS